MFDVTYDTERDLCTVLYICADYSFLTRHGARHFSKSEQTVLRCFITLPDHSTSKSDLTKVT